VGGLKDRISADLKDAMKARDQVRVDTLRSALSAFSYRKIEAGRELDEPEAAATLRKLVKQRSDSIVEFERGNRPELAAKESRERDILSSYLPAQKSEDDVRGIVALALAGLPPEGRSEGALMKIVMPQLRGEADGGLVRRIVLEVLGNTGRPV
jgi:uncharacterized protein YqeY